jgi:hypothetical protein
MHDVFSLDWAILSRGLRISSDHNWWSGDYLYYVRKPRLIEFLRQVKVLVALLVKCLVLLLGRKTELIWL